MALGWSCITLLRRRELVPTEAAIGARLPHDIKHMVDDPPALVLEDVGCLVDPSEVHLVQLGQPHALVLRVLQLL